jgi:outer membrane protein assembly factor BamB
MSEPEPRPLRLWPAVLIVLVAAFLVIVPPRLFTREMAHFLSQFGAIILSPVLILVWWVTASRARGTLRWLPPLLFVLPAAALLATVYAKAPMNLLAFGPPFVALLWLGWLLLGRAAGMAPHTAGVAAVILTGWAVFATVRIDQTDSEVHPEFRWFWTPTAEERFLAERPAVAPAAALAEAKPVAVGPGDWAEFRGPNRDARVTGLTVGTDWAAAPPKLVWKHRVGPGWGTFSVASDRLFTQEQRGENECVACYDAATGGQVWEWGKPARFYEGIAGAGPRATPTVRDGRLYVQGATGLLSCLDAATGKEVWVTDIKADTGGVLPQWGYASSPLVTKGGLVIVFAGGPGGKGTAAFRADTGKLAWAAGDATHSYSSAQLATLGGVEQVLMVSDYGLEAFAPADGRRLWQFVWDNRNGGNRVCQPLVIDNESVLVGTGAGKDLGTKRLKVTRDGDAFKAEVVWSTRKLKPYFNDAVIHKGHVYGFDDKSLVCLDLADGKQQWSAGPVYAHGQLVLLADQDVLVVLAMDGKVALVAADPAEYRELAKFPAITGKTWNHPVVARGRLYVRNGEEAACYELPAK